MADFIVFDEGAQSLLTTGTGLPATCFILLSSKSASGAGTNFTKTDTLAGTGVGEITGTGYGRQSQAAPTPSGENTNFAQATWSTGAATDWPAVVRSAVLVTTSNNTGKALCAWNLITGGVARDMSQASTTENFTGSLNTTSP